MRLLSDVERLMAAGMVGSKRERKWRRTPKVREGFARAGPASRPLKRDTRRSLSEERPSSSLVASPFKTRGPY